MAAIVAFFSLVGVWQYDSYVYKGRKFPITNPNLVMQYEFDDKGTDRLSWTYLDTGEFCDRRASFSIHDGLIDDIVTYVNPKNSLSCASDQNMQLNSRAVFAFRIRNGRLETDADLGSEVVTYLWRRIK